MFPVSNRAAPSTARFTSTDQGVVVGYTNPPSYNNGRNTMVSISCDKYVLPWQCRSRAAVGAVAVVQQYSSSAAAVPWCMEAARCSA